MGPRQRIRATAEFGILPRRAFAHMRERTSASRSTTLQCARWRSCISMICSLYEGNLGAAS
ncbi:uncharacterized protein TRAVEDRAFT_26766, partial [Trametes versicolor FP-101664 SS1]|uniref:uncharacterized protein n=1 Tax=Trametes versicolor (strain FP-101664) TaxID=717944 RepID=UPI0004621695